MTLTQNVVSFFQGLSELVVPQLHDGEVRVSAIDLETFKARENLAARVSYFNPGGGIYATPVGSIAPEVCVIVPSQLPSDPLMYLVETKIDGEKGRAIINDRDLTVLIEDMRAQVKEHGRVEKFSIARFNTENS